MTAVEKQINTAGFFNHGAQKTVCKRLNAQIQRAKNFKKKNNEVKNMSKLLDKEFEKKMMADTEKILSHFGLDNQIDKTIEEMAELIVALNQFKKVRHGKKDKHLEAVTKVIEEIADCQIMLDQMTISFGMEDIVNVIDKKLNRTMKRIKTGYYEE